MWLRLLCMLMIFISVSSIRVPVDNEEKATELLPVDQDGTQSTPVFYIAEDANVDSYLVPPDPHKPDETLPETLGTPATHLLPPSNDRQTNYYVPIKPSAQSDWLPILQELPQNKRNARFQKPTQESIPIFLNFNQPDPSQFPPVPSTHLVPPSVDAVNEFILPEVQLDVNQQDRPNEQTNYNVQSDEGVEHLLDPAEPTLALHLTPPREQQRLNAPTHLYPKKYAGGFKPVPIPLAQFVDEKLAENPKAKPAKYFKPLPHPEVIEYTPVDEKKLYNYQKAEHQRKLKEQEEGVKQHESDGVAEETYGGPTSAEQETSETNLRYPGRNTYPAPLRQAPPEAPAPLRQAKPGPAPDGRTEFRMHGMKGPHSYQFGYDTGKGKNRQFRFEERDNDGIVHGHYGYMDKLGKLRVVNYSAHPEYGFRAEEPQEKEE